MTSVSTAQGFIHLHRGLTVPDRVHVLRPARQGGARGPQQVAAVMLGREHSGLRAWEKRVLSARGVKRGRRHPDYAI
jgi:hypothetical protein